MSAVAPDDESVTVELVAGRLHSAQQSLRTAGDWVRWGASRMNEAGITSGHGFDNVIDEAMTLVLHALHLASNPPPEFWYARIDVHEATRIGELLVARIDERRPTAYLTGTAWFAGMDFHVTRAVLIPRSPFAELVEQHFAPWLTSDLDAAGRIADIGTGSGCIAIACAMAFPGATVDAVDVSEAALDVAARNVADYGLEDRLRLLQGNLLEPLEGRYQLIVSNPPYVDGDAMRSLSPEHGHEPALGLESGEDGLDATRALVAGARQHLTDDGMLFVEVGESRPAFEAAFPDLPVMWPAFEGDGGIFAVTARDLP